MLYQIKDFSLCQSKTLSHKSYMFEIQKFRLKEEEEAIDSSLLKQKKKLTMILQICSNERTLKIKKRKLILNPQQ